MNQKEILEFRKVVLAVNENPIEGTEYYNLHRRVNAAYKKELHSYIAKEAKEAGIGDALKNFFDYADVDGGKDIRIPGTQRRLRMYDQPQEQQGMTEQEALQRLYPPSRSVRNVGPANQQLQLFDSDAPAPSPAAPAAPSTQPVVPGAPAAPSAPAPAAPTAPSGGGQAAPSGRGPARSQGVPGVGIAPAPAPTQDIKSRIKVIQDAIADFAAYVKANPKEFTPEDRQEVNKIIADFNALVAPVSGEVVPSEAPTAVIPPAQPAPAAPATSTTPAVTQPAPAGTGEAGEQITIDNATPAQAIAPTPAEPAAVPAAQAPAGGKGKAPKAKPAGGGKGKAKGTPPAEVSAEKTEAIPAAEPVKTPEPVAAPKPKIEAQPKTPSEPKIYLKDTTLLGLANLLKKFNLVSPDQYENIVAQRDDAKAYQNVKIAIDRIQRPEVKKALQEKLKKYREEVTLKEQYRNRQIKDLNKPQEKQKAAPEEVQADPNRNTLIELKDSLLEAVGGDKEQYTKLTKPLEKIKGIDGQIAFLKDLIDKNKKTSSFNQSPWGRSLR